MGEAEGGELPGRAWREEESRAQTHQGALGPSRQSQSPERREAWTGARLHSPGNAAHRLWVHSVWGIKLREDLKQGKTRSCLLTCSKTAFSKLCAPCSPCCYSRQKDETQPHVSTAGWRPRHTGTAPQQPGQRMPRQRLQGRVPRSMTRNRGHRPTCTEPVFQPTERFWKSRNKGLLGAAASQWGTVGNCSLILVTCFYYLLCDEHYLLNKARNKVPQPPAPLAKRSGPFQKGACT